jgi:hydroxymethylbilane synthase
VTVRSGDSTIAGAARSAVHHDITALEVGAERAFLRRLEGGCQVPIAAYAVVDRTGSSPGVTIKGRVLSLAGDRMVEGEAREDAGNQSQADAAGVHLAERLLDEGAGEILLDVRSAAAPPVPEP